MNANQRPQPSAFDTSTNFEGALAMQDLEIVASKVVIVSQKIGNDWRPITTREYSEFAGTRYVDEADEFASMVALGLIHLDHDGKLNVTDEFFETFQKFVKK
jgi:hypothetical protein